MSVEFSWPTVMYGNGFSFVSDDRRRPPSEVFSHLTLGPAPGPALSRDAPSVARKRPRPDEGWIHRQLTDACRSSPLPEWQSPLTPSALPPVNTPHRTPRRPEQNSMSMPSGHIQVLTALPATGNGRYLYLGRMLAESTAISRDGEEVLLGRSDLVFCDPTRPRSLRFDGACEMTVFRISRQRLALSDEDLDRVTGMAVRGAASAAWCPVCWSPWPPRRTPTAPRSSASSHAAPSTCSSS
ncbi:AraC-like ligand-binding domain-containing protein [Streptomyces griseosporeus]|uniref:AraC-like ligand-binding domain-containing protein n=1 Tax=Streptomyces griseosporeus TaxID=1910 RepID=UPI0036A8590B